MIPMNKLPALIIIFAAILSCQKNRHGHVSVVTALSGSATVEHQGLTSDLVTGTKLFMGDKIITGIRSTAILVFSPEEVRMEIQPESTLTIQSYTDTSREFHMDRGKVWLQVQRLPGSSAEIKLVTPTSVASVRGTKFYTARLASPEGEIELKCQCEGSVEYSVPGSSFSRPTEKDTLTVSRGSKTVVIPPEELTFMGYNHNHSEMDSSPLGNKTEFTPEKLAKFMEFIDNKLKATP